MKKNIIRLFCIICVLFVLLFLAACESAVENPTQIIESLVMENEQITELTEAEQETVPTKDITETQPQVTNSIVSEPSDETEPPIVNDDELVEITTYIPGVIVDLKYATEDNFTGQQIYNSNQKAMLRYGTTMKLLEAQKELNSLGYTIIVWDAYRPTYAQFKLWDVCPDPRYVANPTNGGFSSHSRGNTIDITICKLDGSQIEMPTKFDDFSKEADRDYSDISKASAENSKLLEDVMKKHDFVPYSAEWWHFSDSDQYDVIKEG